MPHVHVVEIGFEVPLMARIFMREVVLALWCDLFAEGPIVVARFQSPLVIRDHERHALCTLLWTATKESIVSI